MCVVCREGLQLLRVCVVKGGESQKGGISLSSRDIQVLTYANYPLNLPELAWLEKLPDFDWPEWDWLKRASAP